jgi:hypothetical protein
MRRALLLLVGLAACHRVERAPPPLPTPRAVEPPAAPASKMAAAPEPAEPPYDIGADRENRVRLAREELGAKTVTAVVADTFVVIGPPGSQASFDPSVALMRKAMAGFENGRFGAKPKEAISVYLFPNRQGYEEFCARHYRAPCIAHFGFYQPGDRAMVMNIGLGLGTLTHEMVHPLVEADFPSAPTWLNEGIASVFEQPILPRPGEIHGGKNWRHPRLLRALGTAEKDRARLDRLFGMTDEAFRGETEDLHYALARYVCQWLDERGKLWPFYQRWRDTAAADPTGAKAFEEVIGMTPAAAHTVWAKWVTAL